MSGPCRGCGRKKTFNLFWGLCSHARDDARAMSYQRRRGCWWQFCLQPEWTEVAWSMVEHDEKSTQMMSVLIDRWLERGRPRCPEPRRPPPITFNPAEVPF